MLLQDYLHDYLYSVEWLLTEVVKGGVFTEHDVGNVDIVD